MHLQNSSKGFRWESNLQPSKNRMPILPIKLTKPRTKYSNDETCWEN